jgi:hypothetical protein
MMTERCGRCANLSGLCAMVGCGGFVEKAPLEAVEEIDNSTQQANTAICPYCKGERCDPVESTETDHPVCPKCRGTGTRR